jgi:hypothetical protein
MSNKTGIAVITCDRPQFLTQAVSLLPADVSCVVNDGREGGLPAGVCQVQTPKPYSGVAVAKNEALQWLLKQGCQYLFLMEDDIRILREDALETYIKLHEESGIHHFNFALHGPANRNQGVPVTKTRIKYDSLTAAFYHGCVGAFSFYTRDCIEGVGFMDPTFYNAQEHLDHTLRLCRECWCPPYWWFADLDNSEYWVHEIEFSDSSSCIRRNPEQFRACVAEAHKYFEKKWGYRENQIPAASWVEFNHYIEEARNGRKPTPA